MKFKDIVKYVGIIVQSKLNKKFQKRFIDSIPEDAEIVDIKKFADIYLIDYFKEIHFIINNNMAKDKEIVIRIIENTINKNKKILIREEIRIFDDNDIKIFSKLSSNILLDQRYIDKSKSISKNQILTCDILSYSLIIDKLDYFENKCNLYCKNEFEKVIFTIVQLVNYLTYIDTLEFEIGNSCLTNAFLLKTGVCIDFSVALWKCLDRLGIESVIIKGVGNTRYDKNINSATLFNHAWNQIKLKNNWYNLDITWYKSSKKLDYILANDEIFYMNNSHQTRFEKNKCKNVVNKNLLRDTIIKFEKMKNVFEEYDRNNVS